MDFVTRANRQSRRDFLQGRTVAPPTEPLLEMARGAGPLVSLCRRAMACDFDVQLPANNARAAQVALDALDLLEPLEDQMTVYRDDGELVRINRQAAVEPVCVEPRLFALLELAQQLHRDTDGAMDLTTGPLSRAWGFSRRQGRLPSDAEIAAALADVGMDQVVLDATNRTVAFRRPGVSLHLNCIGKGYALDRMAELLAAGGVEDFLLHGGRSSVLARGHCPGRERPGWTIGLPHPLRPGERLGEIDLLDQALGTSGSGTQFFEHGGRRYGHLLDPRNGRPVEGSYYVTVIAPTAAEADALATAFYIMGPEKTRDYCASRSELAAILVRPGDADDDVRVHTIGLDDGRWRLPAS